MRASMVTLTPYFSANRMVREYTERFYVPLAENYHKRTANNAALGLSLTKWLAHLNDLWPKIHVAHIEIEQRDNQHFFSLQIYLGDLTAQDVTVEVYSDPTHDDEKNVYAMRIGQPIPGAVNGYAYSLSIPATRPISDYTPRIRSQHPDCLIPLETHHILWVR
jgi:starch phosphorylase